MVDIGSMKLPVWLTVFVSGLVGSWAGGLVAGLLVVPMLYGADRAHNDLSHVWIALSLGSALAQAAITALVLMVLLPSMSGIRVGFGTALVATICGYLVSTILLVLLFHAAIHDNVGRDWRRRRPAGPRLRLAAAADRGHRRDHLDAHVLVGRG